jgi:iron complex transport system substrate-binding protein
VRGLVLILFAAFAATVLGCQESGFDERRETAKPLKVQHARGESKVPGQAERPVTLTTPALDDSLALGVTPVRAALPEGRVPSYLRSRAEGVEAVDPVTARDLAVLEAADPDVIIGSAPAQGALYQELRRIAPTVMLDGGGVRWKLDLRLQGEALGRTNDAERLLIDYDARSGRLQDRLGKRAGETEVSVVRVTRREVRMAGLDSFAGTVIGDLGLARPPAQERRGRPYETVVPSQFSGLDGDLLLLSAARGAAGALRRLEARPEWRRLRAVRSGRVVPVDDGTWWSGGGALAARKALQELDRAL